MKQLCGAMLAAFFLIGVGNSVRADDVNAILDKAIKALGGEEKLSKVQGISWKSKTKFSFDGNDGEADLQLTAQGLDHSRQEMDAEFGGNAVKIVTVLAGDKGWRKFGDTQMELDKDAVAQEKQRVYLAMVPVTMVPLKGKGFKVESTGEAKVGDKPADRLKITGPDGKEFTLYIDKESGLPVRQVAKVVDFRGGEYTQDTTFADYKEMDGIKKATKVDSKRDGEKFLTQRITEFKRLEKLDPKTFTEP
jgi:hypothetical protein